MTNAPRSITDVEPKNWYQIGFAEGAASRDAEIESLRQQLEGVVIDSEIACEDKLEVLRQQLYILKAELKAVGNAIDDPRTDLTHTMSEIIVELKQQLSDVSFRNERLVADYAEVAQQLSASQKREVILRDAVLYVYEHYGKSSFDWHYTEKALAATAQGKPKK